MPESEDNFSSTVGFHCEQFYSHCFSAPLVQMPAQRKRQIICFIMEIIQPGTSSFISYVMLNRSDLSIKSCCLLFFGSTVVLVGP